LNSSDACQIHLNYMNWTSSSSIISPFSCNHFPFSCNHFPLFIHNKGLSLGISFFLVNNHFTQVALDFPRALVPSQPAHQKTCAQEKLNGKQQQTTQQQQK
jgi:hypothetical protein